MKPIVFVKCNCKPIVAYNCHECIAHKVSGYTPLSIKMSEACLHIAMGNSRLRRRRNYFKVFCNKCEAYDVIVKNNIKREVIDGIYDFINVTRGQEFQASINSGVYEGYTVEELIVCDIRHYIYHKYNVDYDIARYITNILTK